MLRPWRTQPFVTATVCPKDIFHTAENNDKRHKALLTSAMPIKGKKIGNQNPFH
jgi:hypothetical protein